ncbi:hypothetical protein JKP75_18485 [Blastococcus sp. TML/M2B]|uniref:hypothetical protein n=1 Tax=Blastococcus sp. TML/M2B TaxID=2798727 RepID=UPI00190BA676|nr:hypothetical protein [Blastococcus sp. TML/M2B]MBN1094357.1 hypothetical protein [Blastococcus sp. TML/M2B]
MQPDALELSVRYRPATQGIAIGGDWYDAFLQPDGDTVLVIGEAPAGRRRRSPRLHVASQDPGARHRLRPPGRPRQAGCWRGHAEHDGRLTSAMATALVALRSS